MFICRAVSRSRTNCFFCSSAEARGSSGQSRLPAGAIHMGRGRRAPESRGAGTSVHSAPAPPGTGAGPPERPPSPRAGRPQPASAPAAISAAAAVRILSRHIARPLLPTPGDATYGTRDVPSRAVHLPPLPSHLQTALRSSNTRSILDRAAIVHVFESRGAGVRWDPLRRDGGGPPGGSPGGSPGGAADVPLIERRAVARTVDSPEFRGMTFYEVHARTVINKVPEASRVPFRWT